MFSTITFVTLFATALAAPTSLPSSSGGVQNVVPTSVCKSSKNSIFSTNNGIGAFTINNDTLTFDPSAQGEGLLVRFQSCDPNFGGFENTDDLAVGHVFLPSKNQCLYVKDVDNTNPGVLTGPCETSDDSRQILLSWMRKDGQVFWSGETKADGSQFQGAPVCTSGRYGYQSLGTSGAPTAGPVTLSCMTAGQVFGFRLS